MTAKELKSAIGFAKGDLDILEGNSPEIFWCVTIGWDDGSGNKLNEDDIGRPALNAIYDIVLNALRTRIAEMEQQLATLESQP